ncbi:unnamed protein product [Trichogramma brassicae]|uniref:C2H2-type domain-containing protein n=1 Tax=Trichogramma brassicae TaxID=86971 RepID=A0A6H5IZF5_9HYME|nr:unnamed protein product [Trichogramma brassicae]
MNRAESRITHATRVDLIKLKQLRENVKWEDMEERREFLRKFYELIRYWIGELPDLRDIFRRDEIEWLFTETMTTIDPYKAMDIIDFAIKTGYKDDGEPHQLRRATPVHRAARHHCRYKMQSIITRLFRIYDRFDVNCADELGLTHFHVACEYACYDVVEKFFELGQDPNVFVTKTGDTPLHLVLAKPPVYANEVLALLLARGANPNLSNAEGLTPLHVICKGCTENSEAAEILFDLSDDEYRPLRVDARDKLGRTPLQWAVANLFSDTVQVLLDHVDDLSSFDFPTQSHFDECLRGYNLSHDEELRVIYLSYDLMHIVNCLERRGYAIDRSDASTIVKIFTEFGVFKKTPELDEYLRSDEKFVECAKRVTIKPSLSLHDLLRARPAEKAATMCAIEERSRIRDPEPLWWLTEARRRPLVAHLNEIQLRGFCRRWALAGLVELTWLPILCCERVCDFLMNEDLLRICRRQRSTTMNRVEMRDAVRDLCAKRFGNKQSLLLHIKTVHVGCEDYTYRKDFKKNDECEKKFEFRCNLSRPQISVHKGRKDYACDKCEKKFVQRNNLIRHLKTVHEKCKDFACDKCEKKFGLKMNLTRHQMTIHEGQRDYACDKCEKKFGQKPSLLSHQKIVHEGRKDYECDKCEKKFGIQSVLLSHQRIVHEGRKDYECNNCEKKFGIKSTLLLHQKTVHQRRKDFVCDKCEKKFTQKKSLLYHRKTVHDGHKDYACDKCEKKFGSKLDLLKHQRIVHEGRKDYACDKCEKKFGQISSLRHHQKIIHQVRVALAHDIYDDARGGNTPTRFINDTRSASRQSRAFERSRRDLYHLRSRTHNSRRNPYYIIQSRRRRSASCRLDRLKKRRTRCYIHAACPMLREFNDILYTLLCTRVVFQMDAL